MTNNEQMANKKVYLYNKKYAETHGGKAQYTLNINDIIEIKPNFQLKGLTVKYYSGLILDDKGCKLPEETTVDYIKIL